MSPRMLDALKLGGAAFGLGAIAADAVGGWASLLGLAALAAGFLLPMMSKDG